MSKANKKATSEGTTGTKAVGLTDEEKMVLAALDGRLQLIRDRVRGVSEGWQTGFYLFGEGGIGKSFTVLGELDRLGVQHKVVNTRLTAKGLFELLEEYPDHITVLEDCETLLKDKQAAAVLRSALWSNSKEKKQRTERHMIWRTATQQKDFVYTGGLIFTMNEGIDSCPALRAVKTRIAHLQFQPTPDEVRVKGKELALKGYRHGKGQLSAAACLEVWGFYIDKCDEQGRNYDLRTLVNGFSDRLQKEQGHAVKDWRDLLDARIKERGAFGLRDNQLADETAIALEIHQSAGSAADKERLWHEKTGKGRAAFYRALNRRH